jgi:hypothetical protein
MEDAYRALANRLYETVRQEDVGLALDAFGIAMTRVLLEAVPAPGKTHRQVFEGFMTHIRNAGEHVMKVLDLEGLGKTTD